MFWRNQAGKPKEYLATIEAIYYLCQDYHECILGKQYQGEYDNLLFFFKFMYEKLLELYSDNIPDVIQPISDNVEFCDN